MKDPLLRLNYLLGLKEFLLKIFIVFLILISAQVFAQVEDLENLSIEELSKVRITSIATGTKEPVSEAPAVASVITAQEIEAMGATSLEEVLETVPGVHISRSEIYNPKILIRGITSKFNSQVLVMINGIPITSMVRGDRNARLSVIPIKMIAKVEVIRGPGSALYGADAVAGVINVTTKGAEDIDGTQIGGRGGSFETGEAWYLHGATYGDLKTSLMMTYEQTRGQQEIAKEDAQTRIDQLAGTNASLAPGHVNLSERRLTMFLDAEKDKWRMRGSFQELGNVGTGHGSAGALDPNGKFRFNRSTVDLTYHDPKIGENWDLTSRLSFLQDSQQVDKLLNIFPSGANLGNGAFPNGMLGKPEYWERQARFDNSGLYTGIEKHRIRVGLGYFFAYPYQIKESHNFNPSNNAPLPDVVDVTDTPDIYLPELSRSNFYTYLQDQWKFASAWDLTAGVRYDNYSDFGSTINPRMALVWKTTSDLTTKFLYGRAFRAPSFAELYGKNNPINLGNEDLKPETINVYEIAWAYQVNPKWTAGLNLYHYKASNLISVVKDASGLTATAKNYGAQNADGFELETKVAIKRDFSVTGNYAYVKATDEVSDKAAGEYPSHQAYLRGDWAFKPNWNWDTQVKHIGTRDRVPTDNRSALPGYTSVDMTLSRLEYLKKFDLKLSIRNIFDASIREPSAGPGPTSSRAAIPNDLPLARRSMYASVTYRF
jgi:outer membrane receptor protein involved in Fe transport